MHHPLTHSQRQKICNSCEQDVPEDESWLLTYGDAVTLLMTFLVLLLSVSTFDQAKYEQVVEAMQQGILKEATPNNISQFEKLKNSIIEVTEKSLKDSVEVTRDPLGLTIELSSNELFAIGKADIQEKAIKPLKEIAATISKFGQDYENYQIEIEGHTDDVPIKNERFPSNWELSANRATNVVKFFIAEGVDKYRLKAAGYADLFPKLPNLDEMGNPIPENRAKNRRITILVHRKN